MNTEVMPIFQFPVQIPENRLVIGLAGSRADGLGPGLVLNVHAYCYLYSMYMYSPPD